MIGLAGAHRTGKTTMAKKWCEINNLPFITISSSDVIKDVTGGECGEIDTLEKRLKVQRRLVEVCADVFLRQTGLFVTDRTPLDVAAYTLAEAQQNEDPSLCAEINEIVEDCLQLTNSCFEQILLVQPGIPYVAEPGKPPFNAGYQEHIHSLIAGLLFDERCTVSKVKIKRQITDMDTRLRAISAVYFDIAGPQMMPKPKDAAEQAKRARSIN